MQGTRSPSQVTAAPASVITIVAIGGVALFHLCNPEGPQHRGSAAAHVGSPGAAPQQSTHPLQTAPDGPSGVAPRSASAKKEGPDTEARDGERPIFDRARADALRQR